MKHKLDVLYVHGYNGSGSGETATTIKNLLDPEKYNWISPNFFNCVADVEKNISQINEIIDKLHPEIIIGNSLGTFEVMQATSGVYRVLINPVFNPVTQSLQPKIFDDSFGAMSERLSELAHNLQFDYEDRCVTFGFFGALDDVVNCQTQFEEEFGAKYMTVFPNVGHKLFGPQLQVVVDRIDWIYERLTASFDEIGYVKKR